MRKGQEKDNILVAHDVTMIKDKGESDIRDTVMLEKTEKKGN